MTDPFSPATRAVYDAFNRVGLYNEPSFDTDRKCLAAALRAAAGQVVPMDKELRETYLAGYYAGVNRQGFDCQIAGLRAVLAKWGKNSLLAIADELEPRQ